MYVTSINAPFLPWVCIFATMSHVRQRNACNQNEPKRLMQIRAPSCSSFHNDIYLKSHPVNDKENIERTTPCFKPTHQDRHHPILSSCTDLPRASSTDNSSFSLFPACSYSPYCCSYETANDHALPQDC